MTTNQFDERMDFEISQRTNNPDWDSFIGARVTSKHRKKIRRNVYAFSSLSMLATAAVVVFAVFFNTPAVKQSEYKIFISKQVDETHKSVFKNSYSGSLLSVSFTDDGNNSIDNLIDSALLKR
ncbi:MAG: hypothetical protein V1874_00185 [Spirochaetota bacterium]